MFVLGNVLIGLAMVLDGLLTLYGLILIAAMIISFVNADPRNKVVRFVHMATEPVLRMIRRWLPASLRYFPIDIAFLVLGAIVVFSKYAVVVSLLDLAQRLRGPRYL